jgi:hypothetical protein
MRLGRFRNGSVARSYSRACEGAVKGVGIGAAFASMDGLFRVQEKGAVRVRRAHGSGNCGARTSAAPTRPDCRDCGDAAVRRGPNRPRLGPVGPLLARKNVAGACLPPDLAGCLDRCLLGPALALEHVGRGLVPRRTLPGLVSPDTGPLQDRRAGARPPPADGVPNRLPYRDAWHFGGGQAPDLRFRIRSHMSG